MSKASPRERAAALAPRSGASGAAVPIGPRVLALLDVAYRARRPVLLEGPTGIGKSQVVADLARAGGLEFMILDLSLLEPPDLVGLPVIDGGRTRYACPAELPSAGRGILMLEELNRAEVPVMQPALQLLSARRLHGYELPEGWSCVAAVNPEGGDYQVNRLDPALRSRFLQLVVCADRDTWLPWARAANVHPVILGIVHSHPDAFDTASPRSWTYASDVLHVLRTEELADRELVRTALQGYLPTAWAIVISDALAGQATLPDMDLNVLFTTAGESRLRAVVAQLQAAKRIDGLATLSAKLRRALAERPFRDAVERGALTLPALEQLLAPLPGDLRMQCLDAAVRSEAALPLLAAQGHEPRSLLASYDASTLRKELVAARDALAVHRVQLVLTAVQQ